MCYGLGGRQGCKGYRQRQDRMEETHNLRLIVVEKVYVEEKVMFSKFANAIYLVNDFDYEGQMDANNGFSPPHSLFA